jgi:hypothetical protein
MPIYRLVFPERPDEGPETTPTSHEYDSGDVVLEAGHTLVYGGKRWIVSQAPLELPATDEPADVMVWPEEE